MVSSSVVRPPHRRRITLPTEEVSSVLAWAKRYAPAPLEPFAVALELRRASRRWWVREDNVSAWCRFEAPIARGNRDMVVGVPLHFLSSLNAVGFLAESARVEFDLDAMTASAVIGGGKAGGGRVACSLMPVPDDAVPTPFRPTESCTITSDDVLRAGLALSVVVTESAAQVPWYPFTSLTVNRGKAEFVRDWGDHGAGPVEVSLPATGGLSRTVSFWNDVVSRELVQLEFDDQPVTFALSDEVPHQLSIAAGDTGMLVDLGSALVFGARPVVEEALRAVELQPERDDRTGWSPVVRVVVSDTTVEVTLIGAGCHFDSHARLSATVAEDMNLTPELAAEIVAWNDKWTAAKVVHRGTRLQVLRDVPFTRLGDVGGLVLDLVEKTNTMREVMGVFA